MDEKENLRHYLVNSNGRTLREIARYLGIGPQRALELLREIGAIYHSESDAWSLTPC